MEHPLFSGGGSSPSTSDSNFRRAVLSRLRFEWSNPDNRIPIHQTLLISQRGSNIKWPTQAQIADRTPFPILPFAECP
jgi:hypothetical protein